ncbi:MAG: glycosyltransferase, partial [Clostridia bacterium]
MDKKIIALTGGGTGGHIYPNIALLPTLKEYGFDVVYFGGVGDTLERRLASKHNLPYYEAPTVKFCRSLSPKAIWKNFKIPHYLSVAKNIALKNLVAIHPAAVFSKGGYVSLPVTLAALELNIPVFCHESDLTEGLANKVAVSRGGVALKCNPHSTFKGKTVGMPLRQALFAPTKFSARNVLDIPQNEKVLLIVGGSSGATAINDVVEKNIEELTKKYFVLHITGKGKLNLTNIDDNSKNLQNGICSQSLQNQNSQNINSQNLQSVNFKNSVLSNANLNANLNRSLKYRQIEYADNIEQYLHAADLVVSRAGATAVFELSALKCKALFVPLPKGVS